jgi:hypothetical protein
MAGAMKENKKMLEMDVDFRPLSTSAELRLASRTTTNLALTHTSCPALPIAQELAVNALDALQQIQNSLVKHGDHTEMISIKVLISDGRVVFINIDRAEM